MMKTILQGIGIVSTLFASFLGLMFILRGDIIISLTASLVLVVVEFFLIEKFIKSKEEITKKKFSALSIMLWSFYLVLAIPISIFLLHALTIEIYAKPKVQSIANQKIDDLTKMVSEFNNKADASYESLSVDLSIKLTRYAYERKGKFKEVLKDTLKRDPYKMSDEELGILNTSNIIQTVNHSIEARKMKLLPVVDPVVKANDKFLKKYKNVFDKWAYFQINYAFYELDNMLKKNKAVLVKGYNNQIVFPGAKPFDYTYTQEESNLTNPLVLFEMYKPYLLFVPVLFFHLLILLPYLLTRTVGTYASENKKGQGGGIEI